MTERRKSADPALEVQRAISPAQFAKQLGISQAAALRACRDGRVRCTRFGKRFLIPLDEVARMIGASNEGLLEPASDTALVSIAISPKRIADHIMAPDKKQPAPLEGRAVSDVKPLARRQ